MRNRPKLTYLQGCHLLLRSQDLDEFYMASHVIAKTAWDLISVLVKMNDF